MDWRDEGAIVSVRKHGETAAIIEVLTQEHGRHPGVIRGGASRRMQPILQIGAQVEVQWNARLEEHLGSYKVEPLHSRAHVLSDRLALAGLSSMAALICFALPERMALPELYRHTIGMMDELGHDDNWPVAYALWEKMLLEQLGYGLDLSCCAANGTNQDLAYVSPNSGRAVSRTGGADWADRLLPLPRFLRDESSEVQDRKEILAALKTTGFFLENWLATALGNRPIPDARARLISRLAR